MRGTTLGTNGSHHTFISHAEQDGYPSPSLQYLNLDIGWAQSLMACGVVFLMDNQPQSRIGRCAARVLQTYTDPIEWYAYLRCGRSAKLERKQAWVRLERRPTGWWRTL